MTEDEWSRCKVARQMLEHLKHRPSYRKLRLFAVACCRRLERLVPDGPGDEDAFRDALDVNERWADGLTTREEGRNLFHHLAMVSDDYWRGSLPHKTLYEAVFGMGLYDGIAAAFEASQQAVARMKLEDSPKGHPVHGSYSSRDTLFQSLQTPLSIAEEVAQCGLLREIFGNPFRRGTVAPSWLAWNDGTVEKIAQAVYDGRHHDRLPILGDALEDAGCANAAILAHCRQPGEHVRGCWVVDLLLQRG